MSRSIFDTITSLVIKFILNFTITTIFSYIIMNVSSAHTGASIEFSQEPKKFHIRGEQVPVDTHLASLWSLDVSVVS